MKTMILVIMILFIGCAKKGEPNREKTDTRSTSPIEVSTEDSDGDGVLDVIEVKDGSDPMIADVPTFSGDFFKEMTVTLELYNKGSSAYSGLSWAVKNNKIKTSWSDKELDAPAGSLYHERLLKNYAANTQYKKNSFSFMDYNEGVFSHSSPSLYEDSIFEISKAILGSQKNGFTVNRAEVLMLANLTVKSKKFKFLRDPIFDIYYKSRLREGLIFIESKKIDGTYSFNEQNLVYLNFDTNNEKIIYDAILNGGSSLFIKLRDFVVYDNNQRYSEIISVVRTKSIPLTISIPGDQKTAGQSETIYVGTNGQSMGLDAVLKRGLKNDVLTTPSSVDQIRDLSNRRRAMGTTGQNENLRWYIGTNGMSDNLYSYKFQVNDGICVSYLSDKRHEKTPIYTVRDILSNSANILKTSKLPPETRGIKIRVVPESYYSPFLKEYSEVRPDCGTGDNWQANSVYYMISRLEWKNDINRFFIDGLDMYQIRLKNNSTTLLTGNLSELINNRLVNFTMGGGWADLTFPDSILSEELSKGGNSLEVELSFQAKGIDLNVGGRREVGRDCRQERSRNDTDHGCPKCSQLSLLNKGAKLLTEFSIDSNIASAYNVQSLATYYTSVAADFHIFAY